jgi:hypothetical protein
VGPNVVLIVDIHNRPYRFACALAILCATKIKFANHIRAKTDRANYARKRLAAMHLFYARTARTPLIVSCRATSTKLIDAEIARRNSHRHDCS